MRGPETAVILANGAIVDGASPERREGMHVLIRNGLIETVSDRPLSSAHARVIDLRGETLMPGLIDCHVHVVASEVNLDKNAMLPNSTVAVRAVGIMRGMLMRGFTTVRDLGGCDFGLQQAVEDGTILGPRLVICGKGFSQTGGHSDFRGRYDTRSTDWLAGKLGALGRVCDGVEALRAAIREEIKGGGQFIKLMTNGGVASPTDPVQLLRILREPRSAWRSKRPRWRRPMSPAISTRPPRSSARSHAASNASSMRASSMPKPRSMIAEHGAVAVPTLIIFEGLKREGAELGLPPASVAKIDDVRLYGQRSLEILQQAGVVMGYGTDLLGPSAPPAVGGISAARRGAAGARGHPVGHARCGARAAHGRQDRLHHARGVRRPHRRARQSAEGSVASDGAGPAHAAHRQGRRRHQERTQR